MSLNVPRTVQLEIISTIIKCCTSYQPSFSISETPVTRNFQHFSSWPNFIRFPNGPKRFLTFDTWTVIWHLICPRMPSRLYLKMQKQYSEKIQSFERLLRINYHSVISWLKQLFWNWGVTVQKSNFKNHLWPFWRA